MKIYTNEQIRAIEAATIRSGISPLDLINRVGKGVADEVASRYPADKRIVVFAGPDKNGAQALCAARILAETGYRPEVFLFNIGGNR
ncbi:MAG: bifunctional ADP-dependent NAD(P)H-hydrate dehydratase/NAD(P)H-hydrate epimerase, partial [Muribaculaceae bacterium]|nr:bifunctional ADP-dependent NAD(P)H-hydrate dehydratase/NAD(P)H-hydrate epimerase [Muribaculaceae bacterium]